jgi:molybdopterin-guanine dinucleotide biosynthesis protein A
VSPIADEVIVVLAPDGPTPELGESIMVVRDPQPHGGPVAGLAAGLVVARHERILLVGADMPSMRPEVLRILVDGLDYARATALEDEPGFRPLPSALRRRAASAVVGPVLASGDRSLRAVLSRLQVAVVPGVSWRALDPAGATLLDIDRPTDLPTDLPTSLPTDPVP